LLPPENTERRRSGLNVDRVRGEVGESTGRCCRKGFLGNPIRLLLGGLVATVAVSWPLPSAAQELNREYPIKAAYLYNFGRYVRWPAGSFRNNGRFIVGVLGADPFGGSLSTIAANKKVDGRNMTVRRFASLDEYTPCHILFIARSIDPKEQRKAIKTLGKSPVLLVGETPGFAEWGGVINFFVQANKIRFEINRDAERRAQLHISAQLFPLVPEGRIIGDLKP